MKVIVAHSDRQYCNHLLLTLARQGWLERFYTLFSGNKYASFAPLLPSLAWRHLSKRAVDPSLTPYIRHFPLLFGIDRMIGHLNPTYYRPAYEWFDRAVAGRLRRHAFDLVVTYENANRHTVRIAKKLGKTTVLDLAQIHHEDIARYGKDFMAARQWRLEVEYINPRKAEALGYTDYVIALSSFAAESMRKNGWPSERLFTVPLGVDGARFVAKERYPSRRPLQLLFVGTLTLRKGLAVLLEAMRLLPARTAELTLIGPMADARELLKRHAGRFHYLPFLAHDALARHYHQADLFVFPSWLDSWAQTVLEAMACGTPAVVSDRTGAREAVEQGGGWVVPAGDARALADVIAMCADEPELLPLFGIRAADIARTYSWEGYQRQMAEVFRQIGPA